MAAICVSDNLPASDQHSTFRGRSHVTASESIAVFYFVLVHTLLFFFAFEEEFSRKGAKKKSIAVIQLDLG